VKPATSKILENDAEVVQLLDGQKEITELYSELSYDELKGVLENWLNPSASANGTDNVVNDALEAPKAAPVVSQPTVSTPSFQTAPSADLGGTTEIGDLPWETEAAAAPKAAAPKDDVASAFDDLFNN
jgi:hypothetical protein